jgi:hypothetical protein
MNVGAEDHDEKHVKVEHPFTTISVHRESIASSRKEEILLIVWSGSKFKESQ